MIKVMIVDDQELIRDSLKIVLDQNNDIKVTALASDGQECLELLKKELPEVILMDVRMPELDGVQATRIIKELYPEVRIIILTTFDDEEYVYNALKYGASGYMLKGVSVSELSSAIRTVASGGAMINPEVVTKVVKLFSQMAQQGGARFCFCGDQRGNGAFQPHREKYCPAGGTWPFQQGNRRKAQALRGHHPQRPFFCAGQAGAQGPHPAGYLGGADGTGQRDGG